MSTFQRLEDLQPDSANANLGTERGDAMLAHSLRTYGAGRSILADKKGVLMAGNKTHQKAVELGLKLREVHTTGDELVVVVRDDLDLSTDPAARELAYADNRIGQVSLRWSPVQLATDQAAGIPLAQWWHPEELAAALAQAADSDEWAAALGTLPTGDKAPFQQMTFTVSDEQAEVIQAALAAAKGAGPFVGTGNENSNGNALARVCEAYGG